MATTRDIKFLSPGIVNLSVCVCECASECFSILLLLLLLLFLLHINVADGNLRTFYAKRENFNNKKNRNC